MGRIASINNLDLRSVRLYEKVSARQQLAVDAHQKQASGIHKPGSELNLRY